MKLSRSFLGGVAAAVALSASASALASGEVSLLDARSITSTHYGRSSQNAIIDVLVQNLAYDKAVHVHLLDAGGTWIDVPAQYLRAADGNRELWRATFSRNSWDNGPVQDLRFALKYTVNGTMYWDNNQGGDYLLGQDQGSLLVGANVYDSGYASQEHVYNETVTGGVTLKNLAYSKEVKIVYTVDGWQTVRETYASFSPYMWSGAYSQAQNPNVLGAEEWSYTLDVSGGSELEYAIAYTASGQTYWDNNFGHNYHSTLLR